MIRMKALLLFGLLGASAGCTSGLPMIQSFVKPLGPEAEIRPAPELPAGEAAQACLATAKALAAKGYSREGIKAYEMAREANPEVPEIAWHLAVLHDKEGDFDRAEIEYRTALEAQPHNAELLNDMGYYHYRRSQPSEAEKYLRQALDLNVDYKTAWGNLALVLGTLGRVQESFDAFSHVVRPAQAHANVGILLARAGQEAAARQELQRALDLEPNLPQARQVLTRLDQTPAAIRSVSSQEKPNGQPHQP